MLDDETKKELINEASKAGNFVYTEETEKSDVFERFEKVVKDVRKLKIDRYLKEGDDPKYVFTYLSIQKIKDILDPSCSKNGISYTQPTRLDASGAVVLQTIVYDTKTGEEIVKSEIPLFMTNDTSKSWRDRGSAITYARRYQLCSVFNIVADYDDDAKADAIRDDIRKCKSLVSLTNLYNSLLNKDKQQFKADFSERKAELEKGEKLEKKEKLEKAENLSDVDIL